jgi:hypothetical protein
MEVLLADRAIHDVPGMSALRLDPRRLIAASDWDCEIIS